MFKSRLICQVLDLPSSHGFKWRTEDMQGYFRPAEPLDSLVNALVSCGSHEPLSEEAKRCSTDSNAVMFRFISFPPTVASFVWETSLTKTSSLGGWMECASAIFAQGLPRVARKISGRIAVVVGMASQFTPFIELVVHAEKKYNSLCLIWFAVRYE